MKELIIKTIKQSYPEFSSLSENEQELLIEELEDVFSSIVIRFAQHVNRNFNETISEFEMKEMLSEFIKLN